MPQYSPSHSIVHLFQKGQPVTYGKGEVIIGNSIEPSGVYFISSGYVKIYSISDTGDQNIHIIYGSGELFPLLWAYLGIAQEPLFYEAISDTLTWHISRDWFNTFLRNDPAFCYDMSVQLAQQFQIYSDRIDNLEYRKARERLIYRLLFLANRFGIKDGDGRITIDAPITHEIIAGTITLARESVSRELERLEHENFIRKERQTIQLLDVKGLSQKLSRPVNLDTWDLD